MSVDHLDPHSGARILRGKENYWFLGPGGVARLRAGQVTAEGALTSGVERRLREKGLFSSSQDHIYSLTVLTSTDCNLGCGYCFQNDQIRDMGVGYANDLTPTGDLSADFARWHRRALELGFKVPGPKAKLRCRTCGYGDGRYGAVVSPDGTLSSCWKTAGKPGWEVGTVGAG